MIYLSAGHTGAKTGANGLIDEGAETIRLRNDIASLLKKKVRTDGAICCDNDKDQLKKVIADVNRRCRGAKSFAIELHFNSAGNAAARGAEAFVADTHSARSEKLAKDLTKIVCAALGIPDHSGKKGFRTESESQHKRLGFCHDVKCPSVILEVCFVKNPEDAAAYRQNYDLLVNNLAGYLLSQI